MPHCLKRRLRTQFTDQTVRVYQALPRATAAAALEAGTLVEPFRVGQMIWIKPSFYWVLERCRYGGSGAERVLAVDLKRVAFDWLLANSCDATYDPQYIPSRERWSSRLSATSVRLQWDCDRDAKRQPLPWTSPRIGLSGDVLRCYRDDWIVGLHGCEDLGKWIVGDVARRARHVPAEVDYPMPPEIASDLGIARQSVPEPA